MASDTLRSSTTAALRRYYTEDPVEKRHLKRMLALVEIGGDPFARDHFEPGHFTASAFVVSPDRSRVLLILHRKLKRWLQPGGHIDLDDGDPQRASMREVQEETGLQRLRPLGDGLLDVDVHAIPPLGDEPGHEHFDLRYCFTSDEQGSDESDEIDGLQWVALTEVASLKTDDSVRRAAARLLDRWRSVQA